MSLALGFVQSSARSSLLLFERVSADRGDCFLHVFGLRFGSVHGNEDASEQTALFGVGEGLQRVSVFFAVAQLDEDVVHIRAHLRKVDLMFAISGLGDPVDFAGMR